MIPFYHWQRSTIHVIYVKSSNDTSCMPAVAQFLVITKIDLSILHIHVDIQQLLEEVNSIDTGDDYSPFPTKLFFLLYLLLHSPRPIVGAIYSSRMYSNIIILRKSISRSCYSLHIIRCSLYTQGESNLQFMWFVLKQAGVTVPTLVHVKKLVLPDFASPRRVCFIDHGQGFIQNFTLGVEKGLLFTAPRFHVTNV